RWRRGGAEASPLSPEGSVPLQHLLPLQHEDHYQSEPSAESPSGISRPVSVSTLSRRPLGTLKIAICRVSLVSQRCAATSRCRELRQTHGRSLQGSSRTTAPDVAPTLLLPYNPRDTHT